MLRRIEIALTGNASKFVESMKEMEDSAHAETDEVAGRFDRMGERIGRVFEGIGAKMGELDVAGAGAFNKFGSKLEETEGKGKSFGASLAGLGNKMLLGIAGGAAVIGYEGIKIAEQVDTAQGSLQAALRASHESWTANASAVAASEGAERSFGYTDQQTLAALTQGVIATGSLSKARKDLGLATELARYKNVDLVTSELAIDRARAGNLRGIKQLGLNLNVVAGGAHQLFSAQQGLTDAQTKARDMQIQYGDQINKGGKEWAQYQSALMAVTNAHIKLNEVQHSSEIITKALTERLRGQGQVYAETLPGKIAIFKAGIDHLEGDVGNFLIPKLESIGNFAGKAFDFVKSNPALLAAGAAVIGAPIIAALGSFALSHIINPIRNLSNLFTGEGTIGSKLSQLFGGKNAPAAALSNSATELDAAARALSAAADKIGGVGERPGPSGVVSDTEKTGVGADVAIARLGLGTVAGQVAAAAGGVLAAHWLSQQFESRLFASKGPPTTFQHSTATTIREADPVWEWEHNAMPAISSLVKALSVGAAHPASVFKGGRTLTANDIASGGLTTLPGMPGGLRPLDTKPIVSAQHLTTTAVDNQKTALGLIAKTLEGRDKTPQVVKLLDQEGLGKLIGTSAGLLVGRSLTAALKNQTHDWNLPYVIAQGFGKVDSTIGRSLDSHLRNSAQNQGAANRELSSGAGKLDSGASKITTASGILLSAAEALSGAIGKIPTHITVDVHTTGRGRSGHGNP